KEAQMSAAHQTPAAPVGIVMGSDSDWPTMKAAADALDELGVDSSAEVVSAHRMPEDMIGWAKSAADRCGRVVSAGAGRAARLPGRRARLASLPVIGVPVPRKHREGLHSPLSIVEPPSGVPAATGSIGGAKSAGLLAARILGAGEGLAAAD